MGPINPLIYYGEYELGTAEGYNSLSVNDLWWDDF